MSTSVISDTTSAATATNAIKSLHTDNTWNEQKDVEEVAYPAEKLTAVVEAQGTKTQEEDATELIVIGNAITHHEEFDSEEFLKEWDDAMESVLKRAQYDRERMFVNAKQEYFEETGEEATNGMVQSAFRVFQMELDSDNEAEAEELGDVDPAEFRAAFAEALQVAHDLGKRDQEELVHTICNISQELVGRDPGVGQLSEIFARIKNEFAEEASEDFFQFYEPTESEEDSSSDEEDEDEKVDEEAADLNEDDASNNDENEEDDEDYSPETDPFDYSKDAEEDAFESSDQ